MKTSRNKQLTFEQISNRYNMPISEVNSVINIAYNKMVHTLVMDQHFDIWDVVVEMKNYFNMTRYYLRLLSKEYNFCDQKLNGSQP